MLSTTKHNIGHERQIKHTPAVELASNIQNTVNSQHKIPIKYECTKQVHVHRLLVSTSAPSNQSNHINQLAEKVDFRENCDSSSSKIRTQRGEAHALRRKKKTYATARQTASQQSKEQQ
jgi:hypothetical protein